MSDKTFNGIVAAWIVEDEEDDLPPPTAADSYQAANDDRDSGAMAGCVAWAALIVLCLALAWFFAQAGV